MIEGRPLFVQYEHLMGIPFLYCKKYVEKYLCLCNLNLEVYERRKTNDKK